MSSESARRPRTLLVMAVAAYLPIIGVAASLMVRRGGQPELAVSPVILTAFVLVFGLSLPIGERPWAGTPVRLFATIAFDFALLAALVFLAPNPWVPAILFFVLIPVSSRLRPMLRYTLYAAAPFVVFVALFTEGRLAEDWTSLASMVPGFVAIMVFAESYRAVRESSQESRKLLDELVSAQGQLREVAVVEERQRLAQEMHDAVGHRLTVASIQLEAVSRLIQSDPARAAELAAISREQVRAGLAELRAAVSSLTNLEVEPRKLRKIIEETVTAFREGGTVEVAMELDPAVDELDPARAIVLLRCVQEGLTNVQRHSAAVHVRVTVSVHASDGYVELVVEDDGSEEPGARGPLPSAVGTSSTDRREVTAGSGVRGGPGGFGLRSLRERAEAIGGSVVFSHGESGSRLVARLPAGRI